MARWCMLEPGGRPLPSLINNNFERLEQVPNNSHSYYWKCKHCGDTAGSLSGARIQVVTTTYRAILSSTVQMQLLLYVKQRTYLRLGLLLRFETARDLEASVAWASPLLIKPRDADDLLVGSESMSPGNVAAEFVALEKLKNINTGEV
ncbi:uncharacterized protein F5147DRAFT_758998 [Suillus discolor]|uniref:Uncharacterized protein n=1 Tax=Suillus discolor TaxID=1912936 RepID=A0A9P7FCS7_9AGAM|nr:uncharacterized protein F5147DRAFT_758998 [Suillus discolor]KAG2114368.1 hypothetical protein F5147DRAFT_758998 [Suillus discolor]